MIGVAVSPNELDTVREFFELFKTPWEPAVAGRAYRVVVSTIRPPASVQADLLIAYGSAESEIDRAAGVKVQSTPAVQTADWAGHALPLYRGAAGFDNGGASTVRLKRWGLDYRTTLQDREYWRVGYDLFDEVRYLLTEGQPAAKAATPTLDIHIALLRHLLRQSGVSFLEVPPRPAGYDFVCCLTHDVDFFGVRRHVFDRTLAGFVARATLGSLVDLIRGRRPLAEALHNWAAVLSLPFVLLRVLPDFWRPIEDYERADGPRPSTFFVIPFSDRAGVAPGGHVEATRAVRYRASDVASELKAAAARGRELAVHGIDAWRDEEAGRAEMAEVAPLGGRTKAGVRMHWLYFASDSPGRIEAAGFDYDSTCGYNDAVGYRAGTSQVFRLPGSEGLMELPIAMMDTALFYRGRLDLTRAEAVNKCRPILEHARRTGGTVVMNWHDRSLAPERLWGYTYRELLAEIDHRAPWLATAAQAVEWFRWRRSIRFERQSDRTITVTAGSLPHGCPGGSVVVHRCTHDCSELHDLGSGGAVSLTL